MAAPGKGSHVVDGPDEFFARCQRREKGWMINESCQPMQMHDIIWRRQGSPVRLVKLGAAITERFPFMMGLVQTVTLKLALQPPTAQDARNALGGRRIRKDAIHVQSGGVPVLNGDPAVATKLTQRQMQPEGRFTSATTETVGVEMQD